MENKTIVKLTRNCYWHIESSNLLLNGQEAKLTASQKKLLGLMVKNINKPVLNVNIFFEVWENLNKEYNEKSVRNLISSIRKAVPIISIINLYGGSYILRQVSSEPNYEFKDYSFEILDQSKNAIVITNPNIDDNPIIYINGSFTNLFGYLAEDVVGKNCRFMHKNDNDQLSLEELRLSLRNEIPITVNLRNYAKNNQLICTEVTVSPILDKNSGKLKYFLGIYTDVIMLQTLVKQIKERI